MGGRWHDWPDRILEEDRTDGRAMSLTLAVYPVDDFHLRRTVTDHHYRFCAVHFPRRVRWREGSPRPGQQPIPHSAFRALRNRPKSGFLCRCCKRSSYSYGWVAAISSFVAAADKTTPKKTSATNMIVAGEVEVK